MAEGVEDDEILHGLTGYSCDVVQGYHLARPLTADPFDSWRSTWAGLPGREQPPVDLPATDGALRLGRHEQAGATSPSAG